MCGNARVLVPVMEVSSPLTGKRGVSLPFSDVCPSIVPDDLDASEVRAGIFDFGKRAGWRFVEFRDGKLAQNLAEPSSSFYVHHLELSANTDTFFESLKHSTRTSVRRAIKEGVRFSTSRSSEAMEVFYTLNCLTRKRHGLPPQPLFFFRKVHEHIISKGLGLVMESSFRGRVVAAAVCFHYAGHSIMKYAAYDDTFQTVRPNNLLVWEAIAWYARRGYKEISFGRSDMKNEGLRRFKTGWNLSERTLGYYKYNLQTARPITETHAFIEWSSGMMRAAPLPVLKVAGRMLYRHMG
jgi:hypothetical protein